MTAHRNEHVARRRYYCDGECGLAIEPGSRYVRTTYPPGHTPNDGATWWIHRRHLHCTRTPS